MINPIKNLLHDEYKICTNCIMDDSDPSITFNADGRCAYCINFETYIKPTWRFGNNNSELIRISELIRSSRKKKDFDCIIGISGGLDSSYAAYIAKEKMGLRPLLFHVDAGWNRDQSVENIERLVDGLGLDLVTEVADWESVKRMQVAFFRSGIPDQDLVQDAVFFSSMYKFARRNKIKHIITGANYSTECCREPEAWGGYLGLDTILFRDIWEKHGDDRSIKNFPIVDILVYKIIFQQILGMTIHKPLNLVPYRKNDAENELGRLFGWQPFKHKHHESRFTRFYEDFWLPRRFGYDKRRAHFSSLIITNQMSRDEALDRISNSEMGEAFHSKEFEYVAHKLDLTVTELRALFDMPLKTYRDFKNKRLLISIATKVSTTVGLEKRLFK